MSVFDIFKKLDEQKAAQAAQPVEAQHISA